MNEWINDDFKIFSHIISTLLENKVSVFKEAKGASDTIAQRMFFPSVNLIDT